MYKILPLFIVSLMTLCSCGRETIITPSDLIVQSEKFVSRQDERPKVSVPGLYKPVVPGFYLNTSFDVTDTVSELAILELRKILFRTGNYSVYSSHEVAQHDYTIKVRCTELVYDTANLTGDKKIPTTQAASIITIVGTNLATAAPFLGPLGGLIGGFGPLTGIGLGSAHREMNSMLTLDIQLIDKDGAILYSKPYSAGFGVKVAERGSIISSNSKAVASSSAQEAVIAALQVALEDIKAKTN